jgi:hypothetical protein
LDSSFRSGSIQYSIPLGLWRCACGLASEAWHLAMS